MIFLLIAQVVAGAPAVTPAVANQGPEIVVVGRRFRDELSDCLKRGCPPAEEVEAAMNAAAETFKAGRYEDAKNVLWRTTQRNKRYAAQMPGKMSDLYSTYADVANHEGDERTMQWATRESVDVLRRHLGNDHPSVIAVAPRLGEMMTTMGRLGEADNYYRRAASTARKLGAERMAALLTLRRVMVNIQTKQYASAARLLDDMERDYGAQEDMGAIVDLGRARIALAKGKAGIEQLARAGALLGGIKPVLIHEPRYGDLATTDSTSGVTVDGQVDYFDKNRSGLDDDHGYRYADIGFWVRPDGSTDDPQIIQSKGGEDWEKPIFKHIVGRRYAPLSVASGSPGAYRIERYTMRPVYGTPTGSHLSMRIGQARLQVIDLTAMYVPVSTALRR